MPGYARVVNGAQPCLKSMAERGHEPTDRSEREKAADPWIGESHVPGPARRGELDDERDPRFVDRVLDRQHIIAPKSARAGESVSIESVVSRPGLQMCLMRRL